jgi:hypothetical protein
MKKACIIFYKIVLLGCLISAHACKSLTIVDRIYSEINTFRSDPIEYANSKRWELACLPKTVSLPPLSINTDLEILSNFQAITVATSQCEVAHETCTQFCHLFENCSYISRFNHFISLPHKNDCEIIVEGKNNVEKIMKTIIGSKGHCEDLLSTNANFMGGTFVHLDKPVFVLTISLIDVRLN